MNHHFARLLAVAAFAAPAFAQLSPIAPDRFDALAARMHAVAAAATQASRARSRDARLAELFDGAPRLNSAEAAADAWIMSEPGRGGALRLERATAKVGYPEFNGLSPLASAPLTVVDGEARFSFAAAGSTRSSGDMDDREIPTQTTAADYRCRVLADKDLMVCRVSFIPAHDDGVSAAREERYEGFQRESFTPFR